MGASVPFCHSPRAHALAPEARVEGIRQLSENLEAHDVDAAVRVVPSRRVRLSFLIERRLGSGIRDLELSLNTDAPTLRGGRGKAANPESFRAGRGGITSAVVVSLRSR